MLKTEKYKRETKKCANSSLCIRVKTLTVSCINTCLDSLKHHASVCLHVFWKCFQTFTDTLKHTLRSAYSQRELQVTGQCCHRSHVVLMYSFSDVYMAAEVWICLYGITVRHTEHNILLFADDAILFMSKLKETIPFWSQIIITFCDTSNSRSIGPLTAVTMQFPSLYKLFSMSYIPLHTRLQFVK